MDNGVISIWFLEFKLLNANRLSNFNSVILIVSVKQSIPRSHCDGKAWKIWRVADSGDHFQFIIYLALFSHDATTIVSYSMTAYKKMAEIIQKFLELYLSQEL